MRLQIVILIAASFVVAKAQNDPEESDLSKEVAANGLDNAIIYEVLLKLRLFYLAQMRMDG